LIIVKLRLPEGESLLIAMLQAARIPLLLGLLAVSFAMTSSRLITDSSELELWILTSEGAVVTGTT
jgi:hypothetical protein